MKEKKIDLLWSISLIVISIANVVIGLTNTFDAATSDAFMIILCVIILAAVCTLLYTSFKKWQQKL